VTRGERAVVRATPFMPPGPAVPAPEVGSIASVAWHRLVLVLLVLVLILVILPAVLGAAGTQVIALV
jgi:hypothetical protein